MRGHAHTLCQAAQGTAQRHKRGCAGAVHGVNGVAWVVWVVWVGGWVGVPEVRGPTRWCCLPPNAAAREWGARHTQTRGGAATQGAQARGTRRACTAARRVCGGEKGSTKRKEGGEGSAKRCSTFLPPGGPGGQKLRPTHMESSACRPRFFMPTHHTNTHPTPSTQHTGRTRDKESTSSNDKASLEARQASGRNPSTTYVSLLPPPSHGASGL